MLCDVAPPGDAPPGRLHHPPDLAVQGVGEGTVRLLRPGLGPHQRGPSVGCRGQGQPQFGEVMAAQEEVFAIQVEHHQPAAALAIVDGKAAVYAQGQLVGQIVRAGE